MTTTMNLIAKQTVGSGGAATVTFSNIPQTYTDLKVVFSCRTDSASVNQSLGVQLNSTTSGYSWRTVFGNGSSAASNSSGSASDMYVGETDAANATASTFTNGEFYIPNYTSSNNKSLSIDTVAENNGTTGYDFLGAALAPVTAAITSITIRGYGGSGNFTEFSTFYLYGISNSSTQNTSVPYASGGDVITTDGTYWYHAFKASGTFTPLKNLNADVLVIAGGGGGGNRHGGGAGAGGLCYQAARSLTATGYSITVGSGGAGNTSSTANCGSAGSNTVFDTITAIGGAGGGGGNFSPIAGGNGGGGTGYNGASSGTSPSAATQTNSGGATGYGNAGGSGYDGSIYLGGGGGGAGAVGGNADSGTGKAGNGGNGLSTWSSWGLATATGQNVSGTVYYAGGGGGGRFSANNPGAGGYGGGGGGSYNTTATAGTANTGGGGGGGGYQDGGSYGGNGGSGIVIIRYAVL